MHCLNSCVLSSVISTLALEDCVAVKVLLSPDVVELSGSGPNQPSISSHSVISLICYLHLGSFG